MTVNEKGEGRRSKEIFVCVTETLPNGKSGEKSVITTVFPPITATTTRNKILIIGVTIFLRWLISKSLQIVGEEYN